MFGLNTVKHNTVGLVRRIGETGSQRSRLIFTDIVIVTPKSLIYVRNGPRVLFVRYLRRQFFQNDCRVKHGELDDGCKD